MADRTGLKRESEETWHIDEEEEEKKKLLIVD